MQTYLALLLLVLGVLELLNQRIQLLDLILHRIRVDASAEGRFANWAGGDGSHERSNKSVRELHFELGLRETLG